MHCGRAVRGLMYPRYRAGEMYPRYRAGEREALGWAVEYPRYRGGAQGRKAFPRETGSDTCNPKRSTSPHPPFRTSQKSTSLLNIRQSLMHNLGRTLSEGDFPCPRLHRRTTQARATFRLRTHCRVSSCSLLALLSLALFPRNSGCKFSSKTPQRPSQACLEIACGIRHKPR